eukprot:2461542-Amphidinium_carterae.1
MMTSCRLHSQLIVVLRWAHVDVASGSPLIRASAASKGDLWCAAAGCAASTTVIIDPSYAMLGHSWHCIAVPAETIRFEEHLTSAMRRTFCYFQHGRYERERASLEVVQVLEFSSLASTVDHGQEEPAQ